MTVGGSPPKQTHFSPGIVDYVENKAKFSAFKPYQYWCQNNSVVNSNLALQKISKVIKSFKGKIQFLATKISSFLFASSDTLGFQNQ